MSQAQRLLLEQMLPLVDTIDGGCCVCIRRFCETFAGLDCDYYIWWSDGEYSPVAIYPKTEFEPVMDDWGDFCGVKSKTQPGGGDE